MAGTFRDDELSGWTARAESYDRLFTPITNQVIPKILGMLGDVRGKRILDVCCGLGHLTAAIADQGADAEGLDFAPTMVARAAARYPALGFCQGDAESLPFDKNAFDHVVCCYERVHATDLAISGPSPGAVPITIADPADPKRTRTLNGIAQMAEEHNNVRIWGGIHFRNSLVVATEMGRKIAAYMIENAITPTR